MLNFTYTRTFSPPPPPHHTEFFLQIRHPSREVIGGRELDPQFDHYTKFPHYSDGGREPKSRLRSATRNGKMAGEDTRYDFQVGRTLLFFLA